MNDPPPTLALFAVLEIEEPKSFWFGVDAVGRAIEYLPNTERHLGRRMKRAGGI
jgi:hypothetical protein